jgi:hypothetical protein
VKVIAFRNDSQQQTALVILNNASIAKNVTVGLKGLTLAGTITGEQSTSAAYWQAMPPITASGAGFTISVPATSVTSVALPWGGNVTPRASAVSAASLAGPVLAADSNGHGVRAGPGSRRRLVPLRKSPKNGGSDHARLHKTSYRPLLCPQQPICFSYILEAR